MQHPALPSIEAIAEEPGAVQLAQRQRDAYVRYLAASDAARTYVLTRPPANPPSLKAETRPEKNSGRRLIYKRAIANIFSVLLSPRRRARGSSAAAM